MKSLFNGRDYDEMIARIDRLRPESPRLWGRMSAPQMVCHVGDQFRVGLGDIPARQYGGLLHHTLAKWIVIELPIRAPRGKVPTVPEMQLTSPSEWEKDVAALVELIRRVREKGPSSAWAPHPAFGRMTGRQWGILTCKHLHHHLCQFGV